MKRVRSPLILLAGLMAVLPLNLVSSDFVAAAGESGAAKQAVTQSYSAAGNVQKGMIVKVAAADANRVEPVGQADIAKTHGVVVAPNDAALTLSPDNATTKQVFVATYGRYEVLVSTQNGTIRIGDYITVSALDGIGMKADVSQAVVLGKAAGDFDGTNNVEGTATLKGTDGKTVTVALSRVPVDISIAHNPLAEKQTSSLPGFLSRAGSSVANKPVSASRLYLSILVLVVTVIIAGSLLYSGIRNGMIAIGRNPLAKKSIAGNLWRVIIASLAIFIIGLFAVYLLLKL